MVEPDKEAPGTNYVKEAFKWQYNLIGLAGAVGFAVVSASALPLILAAGLELIYIATVPQNWRFRRLVRSWQFADEKKQHEQRMRQLLGELPPAVQERYANVLHTCQQIRDNYHRLSSTSQIFLSQTEDKMRGLRFGYMRLLQAALQQEQYVQTSDVMGIRNEIKQLESALARESPKVQEINRKRIEILTKRVEKFEKIRDNWRVVEAQCSAIEDVLDLIRDQSMTMRDPQELTDRLDTLVQDVEQTETSVKEVEALIDAATPDTGEVLPPARDRIRN